MPRPAGDIHGFKEFAITSTVASKHDNGRAIIIARPPKPVCLMVADCPRQPVLGAEEINGGSFPVVIGKDGSVCALRRRQQVVNVGDLAGHLVPAELIGEILREWTVALILEFGWPSGRFFPDRHLTFRARGSEEKAAKSRAKPRSIMPDREF